MIVLSTMYMVISIFWMASDFDSASPPHNLPMKLLGPKERVVWTEDRLNLKRLTLVLLLGYTFVTLATNYYFYTVLKSWSNSGKGGYNQLDK